ncbi:hypothetical protein B0H34DRAFT_82452 [Crassisporium funariophilum]|nr:hypothetical protein B0H34DRAFT_82452 [Crassisporium funariophilum]
MNALRENRTPGGSKRNGNDPGYHYPINACYVEPPKRSCVGSLSGLPNRGSSTLPQHRNMKCFDDGSCSLSNPCLCSRYKVRVA